MIFIGIGLFVVFGYLVILMLVISMVARLRNFEKKVIFFLNCFWISK
jgi:hypothetical protein